MKVTTLTTGRRPARSRTTRTARILLVPLALALAPVTMTAAPAHAAGAGTVMVQTQRMSNATLTSTQNGWYAKGSRLSLVCFKRGQAVRGYFSASFPGGWDDLWYQVSDGQFVADVDIDTGSNNPVTPQCGTTSSSLSSRVDGFVNQWLGRAADYDGAYGPQCVDLFNFYNRDVVRAARAGVSYAYQLYDTYDSNRYTRLSAGSAPAKGDVAVYGSNTPGSGGAGHVAIVLGTSGSSLVVLQQNANGRRYVTRDNASKTYLRGYLRPRS